MTILEVNDVNTFIGAVQVLRNVSLKVDEGEIVCLVGRNGAGKTSVIRTMIGLLEPKSGNIIFKGKDITKYPPYKRARLGIGLTPDYRGIFTELTVEENIQFPKWAFKKKNLASEQKVDFEKEIFEIFPELKGLLNRDGMVLSGGEGKMVALARALMLNPSLILLDEALEGLAPVILVRFAERIKKIKELGVSILAAESSIPNAAKIADRAYVIERGELIYEGKVEDIAKDKKLSVLVSG